MSSGDEARILWPVEQRCRSLPSGYGGVQVGIAGSYLKTKVLRQTRRDLRDSDSIKKKDLQKSEDNSERNEKDNSYRSPRPQ